MNFRIRQINEKYKEKKEIEILLEETLKIIKRFKEKYNFRENELKEEKALIQELL